MGACLSLVLLLLQVGKHVGFQPLLAGVIQAEADRMQPRKRAGSSPSKRPLHMAADAGPCTSGSPLSRSSQQVQHGPCFAAALLFSVPATNFLHVCYCMIYAAAAKSSPEAAD